MNEDVDKSGLALKEAIDWILRLQESPGDPRLLREFDAWYSQSEEYRAAWQQARTTWQILGEVPPSYEHLWAQRHTQSRPIPVERKSRITGGTPYAKPRKHPGWRWAIGVSTIGVAASLFMLVAPSLLVRFQADYLTSTAQNRVVTLEDGTIVHLAAGSAIKSDFSASHRQVAMLAGEAFFDVSRNPDRPFIVEANGVKVEVLGTAFDVRLSSSTTSIELERGEVGVSFKAVEQLSSATLAPGEKLVVESNSGAMVKSEIVPEEIAAWRDGRLFVNGATIGSVVEQIQRYHHAWIIIPDTALAKRKVTGLYDLHDPDRALRALVQPHGGRIHEISRFTRILSRF